MSQRVLTRRQVREVDRVAIEEWGVSSLVLMENAGRGVADMLCRLGIAGPVVICCAKGNNGGDGFVLARHLDLRGHPVQVVLCGREDELSGDARANYQILTKTDVSVWHVETPAEAARVPRLTGADWIVDALLGTGAMGPPRPPLDTVIQLANDSSARRMAVDVPSGLDCDTGQPSSPTFRADHTCTFVAVKTGLLAEPAVPYVGAIHVLDIGVPEKIIDQALARLTSDESGNSGRSDS
jgi:NAD(P)H-hydrate epimerase